MTTRPALKFKKVQWTGERIARLGFLIGLGWDAKRVAEDPIIASPTVNNLHRQAQRFGLSFRKARTLATNDHFENAARKRGITSEEIQHRLLLEIASDPNLLDNILDDDCAEEARRSRSTAEHEVRA